MNLKIIKLILINLIVVNYFNYVLASELILPKNKPQIEKYDIELNEVNYLLPKKKPIIANLEEQKIEEKVVDKKDAKVAGVLLPLPKPVIVTKIKPPKKSKFYSETLNFASFHFPN